MMMEEACDCAHEQAGQRRLDSLRPTGASTCVVRVQALSLVAVRNNPSPSHHKQKNKCEHQVIKAGNETSSFPYFRPLKTTRNYCARGEPPSLPRCRD